MSRHHKFTEAELKRMQKAVETSGLSWQNIGRRFGCGASTVQDLAKQHGWIKKPAAGR